MIVFRPWKLRFAERDTRRDAAFLERAGRNAANRMREAQTWSKSGRVYYRPGRIHRASAPGEYPAKDFGGLYGSVRFHVEGIRRMVIGTNQPYSVFLRYGTSKMAPRKMSQNAMSETWPVTTYLLTGWVKWAG